MFLADRFTDTIFNYFALPQYGNFVVRIFGNCLQTLLYISAMGKRIKLDNGSKVDLQSKEGTSSLYWAIANRGRLPELRVGELKIAAKKRKIAQHLLFRILSSTHFEPTLADGIPILHLLLAVGQHYMRPDRSVDLFELYISRHFDTLTLSLTLSTLDLLQNQRQEYQRSVSYQEAQLHICIAGSRKNLWLLYGSRCFAGSRLPPVHLNPSLVSGWREAMMGKAHLDQTLATWRRDEATFCEQLERAVVSLSRDNGRGERLVSGVMEWLNSNLEGNEDARYKLQMSGSVGENSKIYPLDEVDLLLQVWLDVDVQVISLGDVEKIRQEMEKPLGKQPVQHLVKLVLRQAYPDLGEIGDELTAETFGTVMGVFIAKRLLNAQLPNWLRLAGGNSIVPEPALLERTKAGLLLNLEYLEEGRWQELSIDLVPTLVLDQEQREKYLKVSTSLS